MAPRVDPHAAQEEWEYTVWTRTSPDSLVCSQCITDSHLRKSLEHLEAPGLCTFCGRSDNCVSFEDLEPVVAGVIGDSYVTVEESGAFHDNGEWSETVEDIQDVAGELLVGAVDHDVFEPLVAYVAGQNAVPYGFVRLNDLWATLYDFHLGDWQQFMRRTRTDGAAAASSELTAALDPKVRKLFEKITEVALLQGRFKTGRPDLWRCRAGSAGDNFRNAQDIGTAPDGVASAGRLNAAGHSCFYGSTTKRGAVIESAKHVGADAELWLGRFVPSRDIYHLDVMEVPDIPSPFAPDATDTRDAIDYLARFAQTISQPNDPSDSAHYLPTQIFTAYLLGRTDGPEAIRFASSIDPTSENWVVFADRDHCINDDTTIEDQDSELFLVLQSGSSDHIFASDYIDPQAES